MARSSPGRTLTAQELTIFKPYFAAIVLKEARIFDGVVPLWLRRDMCAVVIKNRIYLRTGAYQPNTPSGVALLAHELTHVSQFLHGMTWLSYLWSCQKGYRRSAYEIEAYEKGQLISANFQQLG